MNKTLRISFALKNAYKTNSVIYSLRQLPLVKTLLPANLYGAKGLKVFANGIAVIWELLSAFFGKLLYFLLMLFLPLSLYSGSSESALFLHLLLFLSLGGSLMNTYMFNPTKAKYYGVILMRMDAREYALVDYGYSILKLILGYLAFGTLFGLPLGIPLWLCLLLPFSVAGMKACAAAYYLGQYERSGRCFNENLPGKRIWAAAVLLFAAAYLPPLLKWILPLPFSLAAMMLFLPLGLLSARKIYAFPYYREYCQQILKPATDQKAMAARASRQQSDRLIAGDLAITSRRNGFEYLNELFVKRHRALLWQASQRIALVCLALLAAVLAALHMVPALRGPVNSFLRSGLSWFVFIMYLLNRGTNFTRVLFMNCDHSLLTFAFYKKPLFVLRLFTLRLREIVKVNLLPALIIGPGLALLLFCSGGSDTPMDYAALTVSIPALSIFFSVHYLTAYYLLQPYNAGTELKSSAYQLTMTGTYLLCFYINKLNLSTPVFGLMTVLFCAAYCFAACLLVYKAAPKTFRLRV